MPRNVLLVEPNYKNKYPPMGLMKLATYYRKLGDNVRFFKGDLKDLAAEIIMDKLLNSFDVLFEGLHIRKYYKEVFNFIKLGKKNCFETCPELLDEHIFEHLQDYHNKYKNKEYFNIKPYDIVCVTTLFTFYWSITIDTINFVKRLCKTEEGVKIGGIASTIVPDEIYKETGIKPHIGLLNKAGDLDKKNKLIIDNQPLDYSILEEIDYQYPATDAYFSYMTRGCPNKCPFCAVPTLEPEYCGYISLKKQLAFTKEQFGEKRNLLLLDNNVLASECYDSIIDEIKEMGFAKGDKFIPPNEYEIAFDRLTKGIIYDKTTIRFNDRAYIRKIVKLYKQTLEKLKENEAGELYKILEETECLSEFTATKDMIIANDNVFRPLYAKLHKSKGLVRYIDFNQGVEAKLITDEKMKKLAETNIRPLRIAFDHIGIEKVYVKAIKSAAKYGINNLSNYMLYNYKDTPEDLYRRMRINVDLCDELKISIYSFPMKYHPIDDPDWFRNRDWIGEYWNRKFIRAIQAVLNSTKGKIGKGKTFFDEAFGKDLQEFEKILWMPEAFIIYRFKYKGSLTAEWWAKWTSLNEEQLKKAKDIIGHNKFTDDICNTGDLDVDELLSYYKIKRDDKPK